MTRGNMRAKRGFTLIELLIVIGIIGVLVIVLAVAIFPAISKSAENNTKLLLQNVHTSLSSGRGELSMERFQRDAGSLANRIHSDDKKASSQMLLFYIAPTPEIWQNSQLYAGTNYNPQTQPEALSEFTHIEPNRLPWLKDAWGNELWYHYDRASDTPYIMSAGPDGIWENADDLVLDTRSGQIQSRADMER